MNLCVNWGSADLDLVLVRWLCSKFQVQLGLDGTALLAEYFLWVSAKGEALPGGFSSHARCRRKLKCMRSLKAYAQKRHSATSDQVSLARVGCKAKATVEEWQVHSVSFSRKNCQVALEKVGSEWCEELRTIVQSTRLTSMRILYSLVLI